MKKLLQDTRLHLIVLAVSLLVTTTILGLSAFLLDQDEFSTSFSVVAMGDFKINVTGERYDGQAFFAGTPLAINPTVTHDGPSYPAYVFAKIEIDDSIFDFDESGISGDWKPLDGEDNVYYYGTDEGLAAFTSDDSSTIFNSVIIREDAASNDNAQIAVTVYAAQATVYGDSPSPTAVWGDLQ